MNLINFQAGALDNDGKPALYLYAQTRQFICTRIIMRTTLDLPEELLDKAMRTSGERTKTAVIIKALEQLIRKESLQDLRKLQGSVDLDIDLNTLRKR